MPADIEPMTAYMRQQFPFLGVKARGQRTAVRAALSAAGRPTDEHEVVTAIDDIERDRVFAACMSRADDPDFFIRKAIGWILRDLAWVDPDAVVAFVEGPGAPVLSSLSKREALKNVSGVRTTT